jgi:hypothetical protein
VLFNATEPGGNSAIINSLTLTFYNGNNLVGSISTAQPITIPDTTPGNGSAGFLFDVSSSERDALNSSVFNLTNSGTFRIGISANLAEVTGGPESFNAVAGAPVPGPVVGAGFAWSRACCRRSRCVGAAPPPKTSGLNVDHAEHVSLICMVDCYLVGGSSDDSNICGCRFVCGGNLLMWVRCWLLGSRTNFCAATQALPYSNSYRLNVCRK